MSFDCPIHFYIKPYDQCLKMSGVPHVRNLPRHCRFAPIFLLVLLRWGFCWYIETIWLHTGHCCHFRLLCHMICPFSQIILYYIYIFLHFLFYNAVPIWRFSNKLWPPGTASASAVGPSGLQRWLGTMTLRCQQRRPQARGLCWNDTGNDTFVLTQIPLVTPFVLKLLCFCFFRLLNYYEIFWGKTWYSRSWN